MSSFEATADEEENFPSVPSLALSFNSSNGTAAKSEDSSYSCFDNEDDEVLNSGTMFRDLPKIYNTFTNDYRSQTQYFDSYKLSRTSQEFYRDSISSIQLPKLQPSEVKFLQLVSSDNISAVKEYLKSNTNLNINCVNFQGITALNLAVLNQSEDMVSFLIKQPNIDVGDSIFHAIKCNNIKILVMLLDARKKVSPGLEFAGVTHSTDFSEHLTPLIYASQLGHYEIVAMLISRGHTIPRLHPSECQCVKCRNSQARDDPIYTSNVRLAVYHALSSPAYLIHVSSDPILSAFYLTSELKANARVHIHLAPFYYQLQEGVSLFAVELIGCCRTSGEVELILKQTSGTLGRRQFILPCLLMAVEYKQKEFVAHPNTQQVLESYWRGYWYGWRNKSFLGKVFTIVCRVFITPFILIMCIETNRLDITNAVDYTLMNGVGYQIAPRHWLVRHWQIPLNKLITHAAAYFVFLGLVFHISNQDKSKQKRGPPDTGCEFPLMLYMCGYVWSATRMCVMQGPRRYFGEMWNWAEIFMLILFGLTFGLWMVSASEKSAFEERKYWNQYDPTLLAEGTFCLATIFAYLRLMLFCQLNYHLGPLQVSLGKMTMDIYKYIIVFAIIICAFATGLARFYQYYGGMVYQDRFGMKTVQTPSFISLPDTLNTLFWALFCMAPLESANVVLENTLDWKNGNVYKENSHKYTERIGYFCFGCFEVISVIVVLNMLIATMSNTFQRVNDNVAIEWTFGRTQVYVDYMWQTTLPSPYNMVPTASALCGVVEWFRSNLRKTRRSQEQDLESGAQKEYAALMSVLVQRYFRDKKSAISSSKTAEGEIDTLRREIVTVKTMLQRQQIKWRSDTKD